MQQFKLTKSQKVLLTSHLKLLRSTSALPTSSQDADELHGHHMSYLHLTGEHSVLRTIDETLSNAYEDRNMFPVEDRNIETLRTALALADYLLNYVVFIKFKCDQPVNADQAVLLSIIKSASNIVADSRLLVRPWIQGDRGRYHRIHTNARSIFMVSTNNSHRPIVSSVVILVSNYIFMVSTNNSHLPIVSSVVILVSSYILMASTNNSHRPIVSSVVILVSNYLLNN